MLVQWFNVVLSKCWLKKVTFINHITIPYRTTKIATYTIVLGINPAITILFISFTISSVPHLLPTLLFFLLSPTNSLSRSKPSGFGCESHFELYAIDRAHHPSKGGTITSNYHLVASESVSFGYICAGNVSSNVTSTLHVYTGYILYIMSVCKKHKLRTMLHNSLFV